MIVDLVRNDLGGLLNMDLFASKTSTRSSSIHGSYTSYSGESTARGKDVYDCIHALIPGRLNCRLPKIRAMQIIEEIEPTRRDAYCGSIRYIGFDGDAEFNIAIRSLHLLDGHLDYRVGGGIVGIPYRKTNILRPVQSPRHPRNH